MVKENSFKESLRKLEFNNCATNYNFPSNFHYKDILDMKFFIENIKKHTTFLSLYATVARKFMIDEKLR